MIIEFWINNYSWLKIPMKLKMQCHLIPNCPNVSDAMFFSDGTPPRGPVLSKPWDILIFKMEQTNSQMDTLWNKHYRDHMQENLVYYLIKIIRWHVTCEWFVTMLALNILYQMLRIIACVMAIQSIFHIKFKFSFQF